MSETALQATTEAPVIVQITDTRRSGGGFAIFIQAIAGLLLRLTLAVPLFFAGLPWWSGFLKLAPGATAMVENGFALHAGRFTYAMPEPAIAAWAIALVYILCPAAVVIGFLTRVAAFLIFILAILLCFAQPETWIQVQLPRVAMALALVAFGPGAISFDYLIWRGLHRR